MRFPRLVCAVVILALAGFVQIALAAAPAKTPPPVDGRKLIKSVDTKGNSVTIQYMRDKSMHSYTIDELTVLKVNNVPGKITDIKPGMVVDDYIERDGQTLDGLTLSGDGEDPAAAKPKATTKPKPKPTTNSSSSTQN